MRSKFSFSRISCHTFLFDYLLRSKGGLLAREDSQVILLGRFFSEISEVSAAAAGDTRFCGGKLSIPALQGTLQI